LTSRYQFVIIDSTNGNTKQHGEQNMNTNKSNNPFLYIYADGNLIRVRVPGYRSVSFNVDKFGTKSAMNYAINVRNKMVK
jgi:hypothetical protein